MVTRCFTFGSEHAHPLGSFVKITAETHAACREEMIRRYGTRWAFDYSEDQIEEQRKRFSMREIDPEFRPLTCCCCGESAGCWKQHWNRDTGYGICKPCIEKIRLHRPFGHVDPMSEEEIAKTYGIEGVNWGAQ